MISEFDASELSRDALFQQQKPIIAKALKVCRPSKPSTLLTMDNLINFSHVVLVCHRQSAMAIVSDTEK